jgi:hypothetical protein
MGATWSPHWMVTACLCDTAPLCVRLHNLSLPHVTSKTQDVDHLLLVWLLFDLLHFLLIKQPMKLSTEKKILDTFLFFFWELGSPSGSGVHLQIRDFGDTAFVVWDEMSVRLSHTITTMQNNTCSLECYMYSFHSFFLSLIFHILWSDWRKINYTVWKDTLFNVVIDGMHFC